MDPYLEHPEIWPGVHLSLINALAGALTSQVRPKYSVSMEVRMYETVDEQSLLVGIPDVAVQKSAQLPERQTSSVAIAEAETQPITVTLPIPITVRQGYLEVREVATKEVVTAIELLSPVNKRAGEGRQSYEAKRQRLLGSSTHLVEIDLLRAHQPMPMYGEGPGSHYRILVSRSNQRPKAELYAFNVRDKVTPFKLPLRSGDSEPTVNLQQLLNDIYERFGYDLKLDYRADPVPPFKEENQAWLEQQLQDAGLR